MWSSEDPADGFCSGHDSPRSPRSCGQGNSDGTPSCCHSRSPALDTSSLNSPLEWTTLWQDLVSLDETTKLRATRLVASLSKISHVSTSVVAWENEHEIAFSLFRRGCLDSCNTEILEAPLYNNRQIEDAWLFLFEIARRHPNRRKHINECAAALGASYNWSIVLYGSRKIRSTLQELPRDTRCFVLGAAGAQELLESIEIVMPPGCGNESPQCGTSVSWDQGGHSE